MTYVILHEFVFLLLFLAASSSPLAALSLWLAVGLGEEIAGHESSSASFGQRATEGKGNEG